MKLIHTMLELLVTRSDMEEAMNEIRPSAMREVCSYMLIVAKGCKV